MMSSGLGCKSVACRQSGTNANFYTAFVILVPLPCVNKIHAWDKVICPARFILGKYCTSSKEIQGSRPLDLHTTSDILFFLFPPIQSALKDPRLHSSSVQPWPSEPVFDQLPCFLSKQRATGGNCVYRAERRSRSPVKSQGHRDTCLVFLLLSGLNIPGTC